MRGRSGATDSFCSVMAAAFADLDTMAAVSIELDGLFNPMILQPHWLLANGLIDEDDYQHVTDKDEHRFVVSPEFTGLRLEWASVEATRDACSLTSALATDTPDRIRELAVGIFGALPHTPIQRVTVVYSRHFALAAEAWEALAERLGPSEPLSAVVAGTRLRAVEHVVDRSDGLLSVRVEPSVHDDFTTFIVVEDAVDLQDDRGNSAQQALQSLDERWKDIRLGAENIMRCLVVQ